MNMEYAIEVSDLSREYMVNKGWMRRKKEKRIAVDSISFKVRKGEIFGLLGENGAGKTTTIKMLTTLLEPNSGTCLVNGWDCIKEKDRIRPHINFVFGGESGVYRRLSAMDNLIYFASLYRIIGDEATKRAENLLKMVGLYENRDQLVETYSKGMIQRLQIARGLINNPEIILMDEPTIGLDPIGANKLREIIKQIREDGKTVLLTTHYMQEADDLCDNIAILSKGKIVALDSPQQLKKSFGKNGLNSTLEEVFINLVQEN